MTQRHPFMRRPSTSDASTASPEPRLPYPQQQASASSRYRSQTPPATAPTQRSFGSSQPRWGSDSPQRMPHTPPSRRSSLTPEGYAQGAHDRQQHSAARAETRRHSLASAEGGRPRHNSSPHKRLSSNAGSPTPRVRAQPPLQRHATFPGQAPALQSNPSFQQTASASRPAAMYRAASLGLASGGGAVPSGHSTFVNPAYAVPAPESYVSSAVRNGSAIPRIYSHGARPRTQQQAPPSARSPAPSRSGRGEPLSRSASGQTAYAPAGHPSSRHGHMRQPGMPVGSNPRMGLGGALPMMRGMHPGASAMGAPGMMSGMGAMGGMQAAQMMAMQQSIVQNNMMLSRMFSSGRRSGAHGSQTHRASYDAHQPPLSARESTAHHYAHLRRSPSQAPPSTSAPAAAPPPQPSVNPALLQALETKLEELAGHQSSLVAQINDLNAHIAEKDATIREMQTSRKRGAARAEAQARGSREAMVEEMGKLRAEVVTMQAHMNDAAAAARSAGEAKAAAAAAEAQARRAADEQAATAAQAARAAASAEAEAAQNKKLLSQGTVASVKSSERQLNISEHTETDASSESPGQSRDGLDWGGAGGAAGAASARRRFTMRTPWGDEAIGGDTDEGDDLDYFVPIMQKQRADLTEIFHSAQRVAMLPGAPAEKRRSSGGRADGVSKRASLSSGAALTLEL